ncbi:hypothetical protein [Nocardioides sp. LS1]|uniref:hypothetical protein n=1 Tax=Nocardioides sp. LS1 TaxID=1027620 RepID=UPI000F618167|nr:hypothetical protein [Nocardioides sp. LS1]GCD92162.1 hypothetical protein NLS1_41680 [Nocardioides sp. LS1]
MSRLRVALRQLPIPLAGTLVGGVVLGAVGGIIGFVLGLRAHPPTAWFAVLEIGIPVGLVGALLGFLFGLIAQWIARAPAEDPEADDIARH